MGRYLNEIHWPILFSSLESCEDLVYTFNNVVHTGKIHYLNDKTDSTFRPKGLRRELVTTKTPVLLRIRARVLFGCITVKVTAVEWFFI